MGFQKIGSYISKVLTFISSALISSVILFIKLVEYHVILDKLQVTSKTMVSPKSMRELEHVQLCASPNCPKVCLWDIGTPLVRWSILLHNPESNMSTYQ